MHTTSWNQKVNHFYIVGVVELCITVILLLKCVQGKIGIVDESPNQHPYNDSSHIVENVRLSRVHTRMVRMMDKGHALACIDECFLVSRRIWYCSMVQHLSYNLWNASLGIISLLRSCFTNVTICSNSFTHIPKRVGKDGHTWTFFWVLRIVIKFE